jgi:alanyl-tRNA synthetase
METVLGSVATLLKSSQDDVLPALERLFERQKDLEKELSSLKQSQLKQIADEINASSESSSISARVDGFSGDALRTLAQDLQSRGRRCVVLVGKDADKVSLVVATDGSLDAQKTVKELAPLVGGGGGGNSRLALAGGRDASGIDKVLSAASAL